MNDMVQEVRLERLFRANPKNATLIAAHEGLELEFKQTFDTKKLWKYAKTAASFANHRGGYLIFGIKDRPHALVGLGKDGEKDFEGSDPSLFANMLAKHFEPDIRFEKGSYLHQGRYFGVIYVHPAEVKPVICKANKTDEEGKQELREGAIYFRYNAKSTDIKYAELHAIIESEKRKANEQWSGFLSQIISSGVQNISVLSSDTKKLNTGNATVLVDDAFLNSVSYVKEGSFVETGGDPALMVVGEVRGISDSQTILIPGGKPQAISEYDILLSFLAKKQVESPYEYIEQICSLPASTLPVYYYAYLADMGVSEIVERLKTLPRQTQSQQRLIERLSSGKSMGMRIPSATTKWNSARRSYYDQIIAHTVTAPDNPSGAKAYLEALQSLDKAFIEQNGDYVLSLLFGFFSKAYQDPVFKGSIQYFRRAVCWVDEALYQKKVEP